MIFREYVDEGGQRKHDRGPPEFVHGILFDWMEGERTDPFSYFIPHETIEETDVAPEGLFYLSPNPKCRDRTASLNSKKER